MDVVESVWAIAVALVALYGVGLPLALMLPAPESAVHVYRIAAAPTFAIAAAGLSAQVLGAAGVPLRWPSLVALAAGLWIAAGLLRWRTRSSDRALPNLREVARVAVAPAFLVVLGLILWFASLVRFGLYLPNRDFKNHAVFVAQIASLGNADPRLVGVASPVSEPVPEAFYPLGLHTLLGWGLPSPTANAVGVTAAAALLVSAISLPLAVLALARMWQPGNARLAWLAGLCAVCLPGATGAFFAFGSVVLVVAAGLFPAGLVALWLWSKGPTLGATVALALTGLGLFLFHVAEAVGLLLIMIGTPLLKDSRVRGRVGWRGLAVISVFIVVPAALLGDEFVRLANLIGWDWDVQANDATAPVALANSLLQQPSDVNLLAAAWWAFVAVGLVVARRQGLSGFPALTLLIPVVLGTLALVEGIPNLLTLITAPWYGTATRAMALAFPAVVLIGSLGVLEAGSRARLPALRIGVLVAGLALIVAMASSLVPDRRRDLAASLAGAGDTLALARGLNERLGTGGTVLNLEADGTALLFAYARIPVLSGLGQAEVDEPAGSAPLSAQFLDLADPEVAKRLRELDVRYLAVGTTSRYWGESVGYVWQDIANQDEVEVVLQGSDMVILRYRGVLGG